jgi:hypothetical protein
MNEMPLTITREPNASRNPKAIVVLRLINADIQWAPPNELAFFEPLTVLESIVLLS